MIKDQGDPQIGGQFIKRIANDIALGKDVESMKELLGQLLPKDEKTGELDVSEPARKAAAEKLVKSLNGLEKNDRPISDDAQTKISNAFKDPSIKTVDDLAGKLETLGAESRDLENKNSLWALFELGKTEFSVELNQTDLDNLRFMLNRIAPGMGDLFDSFVSAAGAEPNTPETEMRDQLAHSFSALQGQVSLASFQGKEYDMAPNLNGEMEKVPFTVLNLDIANNIDDFYGKGIEGSDGKVLEFQFYGDDPKIYEQSFQSMILDKLEADGTVKFAADDPSTPENENDIARASFVEYAKQLTTGKMLDQSYIREVNDNEEILQFGSPQDEADFVRFIGGIGTKGYTEEQIADQVLHYAQTHDGVGFAAGTTLESAKVQLVEAAQHFVPVAGGREYADRLMEFAEDRADVTIYTAPEVVIKTPMAAAGQPPVVSPVTPAALVTPTQTTPTQTVPAQTTAAAATLAATTPAQSTPAQSTPAQSTPAQSTPAQSTPAQSTPAQSTPAQSTAANPVAAPAAAAKTKINPEDPIEEMRLVDKAEPTKENDLSYGEGIKVTEGNAGDFSFAANMTGYVLDEKGVLHVQSNGNGNHLFGNIGQLREFLGGDFEIERVVEEGKYDRGYFASNSLTGKGVYLDTKALDTEQMSADMKKDLLPDLKAEATKLENKATTPSVGAAPGQTQPPPTDPNDPNLQQSMQPGQ